LIFSDRLFILPIIVIKDLSLMMRQPDDSQLPKRIGIANRRWVMVDMEAGWML
jgi:hypothetical protein